MEDGTKKPGKLVLRSETKEKITILNNKFRREVLGVTPSNLPTSSTLVGQKKDLDFLHDSFFEDIEFIYVYFENLKIIYQANASQLAYYLENKEPWEDSDICVFDDGLKWCLGVTHDDVIIFSEEA